MTKGTVVIPSEARELRNLIDMNKEGNKVKYPYNQFSTKVEEFDFRNIIRRIRLKP